MNVESSTTETPEIYATALARSIRCRHHLFDTLYYALARHVRGASLITADRRYYEKASSEGRIALLADWSPD